MGDKPSRGGGGYQNRVVQMPRPVWQPVIVPDPVFESASEKERYEAALAEHPRRVGEGLAAWFDRALTAGDVTPPKPEPGEEG